MRVKIVDTWDEQYSPIFGGLMKIHLASSEPEYQNRGAIVGKTQPKWRTISIAGIAVQVFPIYGARKEAARREAVVTTVGGCAAVTSCVSRSFDFCAMTNRNLLRDRASFTVTTIAMARGGLSWELNGFFSSSMADVALWLGANM